MADETRGKRQRIVEDIETLVGDVNEVVRVAVERSTGAAECVGENIRETIHETLKGVRSARDSVVMVRVNKESLAKLDDLVEAGIANSRSEAAAFLIAEGTKSRSDLFEKIAGKVEEIRRAKEELRGLIDD